LIQLKYITGKVFFVWAFTKEINEYIKILKNENWAFENWS